MPKASRESSVTRLLAPERLFVGMGVAYQGWGVAVDGDRIAQVGPLESFKGDLERIDLPGQTLMPGLIDMHGYLSVDADRPNPMAAMFSQDFATRAWVAAKNLRQDLRSGVTTMRVMGEGDGFDAKVRDGIQAGLLAGPHILTAGRPIAPTHGHQAHPSGGFDGVDGVRHGVRLALRERVDWVKLVLTGGVNSSGPKVADAVYSKEEIQATTEEAARLNVPVAAAAHGGPIVRIAMDAGVRTIEHGMMFREDEVEAVMKHDGYLVLTPSRFFDPHGIEKSAKNNPRILASLQAVRDHARKHIPDAIKAGLKIVLGSDNNHGGTVLDAAWLVKLGASEERALAACTSLAAEAAQQADIGKIASGCRADLLAVRGNPLKDIHDLQKVSLVMKAGQLVELSAA